MRAYILKEQDFARLLAEIDRDPRWGTRGGTSDVLSPVQQQAHKDAHQFYNYVVRKWIDTVKKEE